MAPPRPRPDPPPTRSTEIALASFLAFAAFSSALIRPPGWPGLAAGLLGASAAVALAAGRLPAASSATVRRLRALLPILLFAFLYNLTGRINAGLARWILDAPLERIEAALFHGQPSLYLAEKAPWLALSEFLHACYFSFYLLVACLPSVLALEGREEALVFAVRRLCLCFFACLFFYIWLPVTSPLYKYPPLGPPLSEGLFYHLAHAVSARGGVVGGAFPSSHAALSVLALLLAWRHERRVFWITLIPTAGLLAATVYGRYHFALDILAGIVMGAAFAIPGRRSAPLPDPRGGDTISAP